jgi:hypothetical protein
MPKPICRTQDEKNAIAWAGAHAAMKELESVGLPLADAEQFRSILVGFYKGNHAAMEGHVQTVGGCQEAKAA